MNRQAVISPAVAPVHKEPMFCSEMISQALMWENVQIQETFENWYQIRMEDGYDGWIHSFYLHYCEPLAVKHILVTDRAVPVLYEVDTLNSIAGLYLMELMFLYLKRTLILLRYIFQMERVGI